jgi:hypothetical protein
VQSSACRKPSERPPGRRGEKTTTPGRSGSCGSSARRETSMPATSDCQTRRTRFVNATGEISALPGGNRRRLVRPADRQDSGRPASAIKRGTPRAHQVITIDGLKMFGTALTEASVNSTLAADAFAIPAEQGCGAGTGRECALAMGAAAHGKRLLSRHGCLLQHRSLACRTAPKSPY